jgi:Xaa-Pro aminopeptidase
LAEIHGLVLRAQAAAIGEIRPGAMCKTADAAARNVISRAGYADNFLHGLGHGIGLAVHEAPALARGRKVHLRAGMVVTVEPGIYLPGVGGMRVEDDILVTRDGRQKLSTLPASLRAMTLR